MTGRTKIAIGLGVVALVLFITGNWLVGLLVIAAAIAVPVGGYLMLDPSQRRRVRAIQQRRK